MPASRRQGVGLDPLIRPAPRAAELGGGDGSYNATGPGAGLRGGVEFFRTTSMRAFALAEVFLPIFWADDQPRDVSMFVGP